MAVARRGHRPAGHRRATTASAARSLAKGHGLAGLADRVRAAGGELAVVSPAGGPTGSAPSCRCEREVAVATPQSRRMRGRTADLDG